MLKYSVMLFLGCNYQKMTDMWLREPGAENALSDLDRQRGTLSMGGEHRGLKEDAWKSQNRAFWDCPDLTFA